MQRRGIGAWIARLFPALRKRRPANDAKVVREARRAATDERALFEGVVLVVTMANGFTHTWRVRLPKGATS